MPARVPCRNLTSLAVDRVHVAPSILAADFGHLANEILTVEAAGAPLLHVDIMDGHLVPNLSMGPPVVKAVRPVSEQLFDVHLMIAEPSRYADPFIDAGADHVTIHVEIGEDVGAVLRGIRDRGCSAGVSLRPGTPAEAIAPYLEWLDMVLVMTVEPGFGGQAFMADMLPKIGAVRRLLDAAGRRHAHVEVDGGIDTRTAPRCVAAGANVLVAGSSVFRAAEGARAAVRSLAASGSAG